MKKLLLMLAACMIMIFAVSFILSPERAYSEKPQKKKMGTVKAMPDDVKKVLQNDCMGCHSTTGNPFAKGQLNLSVWDQMKPEKQAKKAEAICHMLRKNSMPPKPFRDSHPDKVPTDKEVDMICNWTSGN
ncbi:MAG: heme-binding domain-containing protein [Bacteroidota bacterium]|nr:heme-binding domain-containing protein [Bacteroidota bacterium]